MRQFGKLLVAAMGALSLAAVGGATALAQNEHRILEFDSMTPVTGAAVGTVNDRGIPGGGLAWAITSGSGELTRGGHVHVAVTGLVIPARGNVNPIASFKAIVSCFTREHAIVNVSTSAVTQTVRTIALSFLVLPSPSTKKSTRRGSLYRCTIV